MPSQGIRASGTLVRVCPKSREMAFGESSALEQPQPSRGRVLLVDDEPELRRTLRRSLTRNGFEVLEAENGRVALDLLRRHAFEAVVSDVRMPEMDGVQLLHQALREFPLVPVVLMSAAPGMVDADDLVRFGAFEFLEKPLMLDTLRRSTEAAVDAHRALVQRDDPERGSGVQRVAPRLSE